MKKISLILLALVLLLTGCGGKRKDISETDARCPYMIDHKERDVTVTLTDKDKAGIVWDHSILPDGICQVEQRKSGKDHVAEYRISGLQEGIAQLTFFASDPETQQMCFILTLVAEVDANGVVTSRSATHQQITLTSAQEGELSYEWSVDLEGKLTFRLLDSSDFWTLTGDGGEVCAISQLMNTPTGCKFEATPLSNGTATFTLTGDTSGRSITVELEADKEMNLRVTKIRE